MRTPKRFRIWDDSKERMYTPPYPDNVFLGTDKEDNLIGKVQRYEAGGVRTVILPDVMQYAGLDDADDTPIYEGDILHDPVNQIYGEVAYNKRKSAWVVQEPQDPWGDYVHGWVQADSTVAGNRYENTELFDELTAQWSSAIRWETRDSE